MTPLDELSAIPFHEAGPAARARILSRLADTEVFAALASDPANDRADLMIYDIAGSRVALACDLEERLAGFLGQAVAYVALPGRALAAALAAEGQGLLFNPGQASELLLDADALIWLGQALMAEPSLAGDAVPVATRAPRADVVAALAEPLALRISDMAGLLDSVGLIGADWGGGQSNHLLILRGVSETHRGPIAKAMAELLAFLPQIEGGVDLAFSDRMHPAAALVIEPAPILHEPPAKRDPNAPPRLR